MSERWFERSFGERYTQIYAHRDAAEATRALDTLFAGQPLRGRRVLDLACGDGRYLRELRRRGARTVGLDLSPVLLRNAVDMASGALVRADMRALPFVSRSFDVCLSMFTSFGYFEDHAAHARLAAEMGRVTRELMVVDVVNPRWLEASLVRSSEREIAGVRVLEERWIDLEPHRVCKRITVEDGGAVEHYEEQVLLFEADTLSDLFVGMGFAERLRRGDYGGEDFDADRSPRLILLLAREESS